MGKKDFSRYQEKLERNIYGSLKGKLRLQLILQDLLDTYPQFCDSALQILDIGGGSGHFALICKAYGHQVTLVDNSPTMLDTARSRFANREKDRGSILCVEHDFLSANYCPQRKFDLVLMHGSAEWMEDPEKAIEKAISLVADGGFFSLLIFNRDRKILKQGINGGLLSSAMIGKKKKLTPPGARSPYQVEQYLQRMGGVIRMISGIRIFYRFFRQIDTSLLAPEQWLEQEKLYYRKEPFTKLGEHTHFIWQAQLLK